MALCNYQDIRHTFVLLIHLCHVLCQLNYLGKGGTNAENSVHVATKKYCTPDKIITLLLVVSFSLYSSLQHKENFSEQKRLAKIT